MQDPIPKHDPFGALRIREFVLFLITRFFLTMAIQMQSMIVQLQIYDITKDKLSLGMIGLSEAIPFIIVSLFSGHVADVVSRKLIIVVSISLLILSTSALLLFSMQGVTIIQHYGTLPIYFVFCFIGVVRGFISAAFPAFMSQIVPRELYANSATWNSSTWHVGAVLGPMLGGLLCIISFSVAYAVNVVFIILSIASFIFIASKPVPPKEKKESLKESLSGGLKFVFSNQLILGALSLDLFAVLFGGAIAMLPAYADEILHAGKMEVGLLRAAPALGAIFTAIIVAYRPITKNAGRHLLVNVALFGAATICFAVSANLYLSFFFLFLTGAFDNVSVVVRHTTLQLATPDNMRGRVSAVNSIFIGSSNEIGAFESGVTASMMGLVPSVVFGGIMTILIVAATAKIAPKLRKLNLNSIR
ncbi:MAG: MFS transporter [Bacteroidia bacterium]